MKKIESICIICEIKFTNYCPKKQKCCSRLCSNIYRKTDEFKKLISIKNKGKKRSIEFGKLISGMKKGIKLSNDHKKKIGESLKGKIFSEERKKNISKSKIGKKLSKSHIKNMSLSHIGIKISDTTKYSEARKKEWKDCVRNSLNLPRGKDNHLWKGGITPINKAIRSSSKYKNWRKSVFERDNYTCQECRTRGVYLEADHIKPFAYFPDLRFDLENGRTLCKPCHKLTDTYMGRAKKFELKK